MPYMEAGVFREDIVDIDLDNNGTIHRTFLARAIGKGDKMANRFGVRLWRAGEPVNLDEATTEGFFMAPDGQNILISGASYTSTGGNVGWVQLPQACYNVEGQFTLAIKVIDSSVTGTMRIIDGVVDNTGVDNAVAPVGSVPTYQEVLSVYELMLEAKTGSVRYDITQSITTEGQERARINIDAQEEIGLFIDSNGYICQTVSS